MPYKRPILIATVICIWFAAPLEAQTTTELSPTQGDPAVRFTFRFPLGTPTSYGEPSLIYYPSTAPSPLRPNFATEVPALDTRAWKHNPSVGFRSGISTPEVPVPFCGLPTQGAAFNVSGRDAFLPCLADRFLQWALQSVINR